MATLNGTNLGAIQRENHSKDSSLFQFPMPRSDSNRAVMKDIFGVMRTISIDGIFYGTEAEQRTFISAIETLENGTQDPVAFVSSLITSPSSYNVLIQNFSWNKEAADQGKISYTLTLIEGRSL